MRVFSRVIWYDAPCGAVFIFAAQRLNSKGAKMRQVIRKKSIYIIYSIFSLIFLNLLFINSASADNLDYSITIKPSMSLTIPTSSVTLTLNPSTAPFASEEIDIIIGTNNYYGYWLTMSSSSGNTELVNTNDNTKTIPTLTNAGDYDENTFETNTWGYKVNSGQYLPFVSGDIISKSNTRVNGETIKLTLASKIGYSQVPGTYSTNLVFKALPIITTYYMQNLDPTLCTEDPMAVIDNRDEQPYTIQKLKDGKCWMMTNLNLGAADLQVEQLDSSNTNINNGSVIATDTFSSWKKEAASSTYVFPIYIPLTNANSTSGSDTDPTTNTKYGTIYNYCAASASTICVTANSSDASSDICPAGWRLPIGGASNSSTNEFNILYELPDYNTNAKMRGPLTSGGAAFALAGGFNSIDIRLQNSDGNYWSSTPGEPYDRYCLGFNTSVIIPGIRCNRGDGFSIRCILK